MIVFDTIALDFLGRLDHEGNAMTRLTIDSEMRAKLGDCRELVEVCDESGRVVGFFHPTVLANVGAAQHPSSPISDEEIETARNQRTGRPLADILADLDRQS